MLELHKANAKRLLDQGRMLEAREAYREICQRSSSDLEAWTALGEIHANLDNLDDVITCFRHVVTVRPREPSGYLNLASVLMARKAYDEAIPVLERAHALRPDFVWTHRHVCCCHRQLGRYEVALEICRRALGIPASTLQATPAPEPPEMAEHVNSANSERLTVTIGTSLAPRNLDNQREAVASWLALGFKVISLAEAHAVKRSLC